MVQCPVTVMSPESVRQAFLAAIPYLSSEILDRTVKTVNYIRDIPEYVTMELGAGTQYEQLEFRSSLPLVERGFEQFTKIDNNTGCDPCAGPTCLYNTTYFGGGGFNRRAATIFSRDFESPRFCIKQIETTAHFEQVWNQIVKTLALQADYFISQNIIFNALTGLAKKYVVDSSGIKTNKKNPYAYPNIGTARISELNLGILEAFYSTLRRITNEAEPYHWDNGAPVFAISASDEVLAALYYNNPTLRQDLRYTPGGADALLTKYNFMTTLRGMFFPAPIDYPRRFYIENGEPIEILPHLPGMIMEAGQGAVINPDYLYKATHEEVIINGKNPFKIIKKPTATSLPGGATFGGEPTFLEYWKWINPETTTDPAQREGFFWSHLEAGIMAQNSDGLYALLVELPSRSNLASWSSPGPQCPPEEPVCNNVIPAQACPAPLVINVTENPLANGQYFVTLSVPVDVEVDDVIDLATDNGGYVEATVEAVNETGTVLSVTFPNGFNPNVCAFVGIYTGEGRGCSATVVNYTINCLDATRVDLTISNLIKADNGENVVLYYGNGTTATVSVVSQDFATNKLVIDVGGSNFCDNVSGIGKVCVPPTTDASCPSCDPSYIEACST